MIQLVSLSLLIAVDANESAEFTIFSSRFRLYGFKITIPLALTNHCN